MLRNGAWLCFVFASAALELACESDANFSVQLPDLSDQQSGILVFDDEGDVSAEAFAVEQFDALIRAQREEAHVYLFLFRDSLEELGLESGALLRASDQTCARVRIDSADEKFVLSFDESRFVETALEPRLEGLSFVARCPCVSLEPQRVRLPFGELFDIIAAEDGRWFVLGNEAQIVLDGALNVETSTSTAGFEGAIRGHRVDDGVRMLDGRGGLYFWNGRDPAEPLVDIGFTVDAIDGAPDGSETYLLLATGKVFRFDGDSLETLWDEPIESNNDQGSVIEWIGPRRVTLAQVDGVGLLELGYQGSTGFTRTPWNTAVDTIGALSSIPSLGLVLVTETGDTSIRPSDDSDWGELLDEPLRSPRRAAPFGAGFLQIGLGAVAQYHPRSAYCPPISISEAGKLGAIAGDESRGWLVGATGDPSQTVFYFPPVD